MSGPTFESGFNVKSVSMSVDSREKVGVVNCEFFVIKSVFQSG